MQLQRHGPCTQQQQCRAHRQRAAVPVRPCVTARAAAAAVDAPGRQSLIEDLRQAAKKPGTVPAKGVLERIVQLEKSKWQPDGGDWSKLVNDAWQLVYVAPSEAVKAATQGGEGAPGNYVPIVAAQYYDYTDQTFENGVFLGNVAHLTFKGPFKWTGRQFQFDVHTMILAVGPWRVPIPLKRDAQPIDKMDTKDQKGLPFFLFCYVDDTILIGRGRSGGLAMWVRPTADAAAKGGFLQVYGKTRV